MGINEDQAKTARHEQAVSDETIAKMAKEVAVKFIEMGRITPATFPDNFREIYQAIATTVRTQG